VNLFQKIWAAMKAPELEGPIWAVMKEPAPESPPYTLQRMWTRELAAANERAARAIVESASLRERHADQVERMLTAHDRRERERDSPRDDAARLALRIDDLLDANNRYQQEARTARAAAKGGFQGRVQPWIKECFGDMAEYDTDERIHRFVEEAIELAQASGCTADETHQLVDYVFGRKIGEPAQEVGGVMVTLAALCSTLGIDMDEAAEVELNRCWSNIAKIRAKQASKPKHSPLPGATKQEG